ncbi:MAG: methionyl-tRNA formyltransferase [bacterium]
MDYNINNIKPMKIIFMGTPEIASDSLISIIELTKNNIADLKCIYTKPEVWNNKKSQYIKSSVNIIGDKYNIPVRTPKTIKNNQEEIDFLVNIKPDLIIVVAYGLILPKNILDIPLYGTINLHPSILPDLRGPSPVHYALLENLKYTGISIMALDEGMDTGPLIAQMKTPISKDEYFEELYGRLSKIGAYVLSDVIKTLALIHSMENIYLDEENKKIYTYASPQSASILYQKDYKQNLTITDKMDDGIRKINFSKDKPDLIYSKIRTFSVSDPAYFIFEKKMIKVIRANLIVIKGQFENCNENLSKNNSKAIRFKSKHNYCEFLNEDLHNDNILYKKLLPELSYNNISMQFSKTKKIESNINNNSNNNDNNDNTLNTENKYNPELIYKPGTVVIADKSGLVISTLEKGVYLKLLELKPESKKSMNYIDFINGLRIKSGIML